MRAVLEIYRYDGQRPNFKIKITFKAVNFFFINYYEKKKKNLVDLWQKLSFSL